MLRGSAFHGLLGVNPESVGDTIDVVEVTDDVNDLENLPIIEPHAAQAIEVGGRHFRGRHC